MGFDLVKNNLSEKAEEGYRFELMLPEINEGTDAYLTVRGDNSPKVKAHSKRVFQNMQQKEKMAKRKGREADDISLDEAEDMAINAAYVRLIAWENFEEDGVELPFDEETVKRVLREHEWIRSAVLEESANLANFI